MVIAAVATSNGLFIHQTVAKIAEVNENLTIDSPINLSRIFCLGEERLLEKGLVNLLLFGLEQAACLDVMNETIVFHTNLPSSGEALNNITYVVIK